MDCDESFSMKAGVVRTGLVWLVLVVGLLLVVGVGVLRKQRVVGGEAGRREVGAASVAVKQAEPVVAAKVADEAVKQAKVADMVPEQAKVSAVASVLPESGLHEDLAAAERRVTDLKAKVAQERDVILGLINRIMKENERGGYEPVAEARRRSAQLRSQYEAAVENHPEVVKVKELLAQAKAENLAVSDELAGVVGKLRTARTEELTGWNDKRVELLEAEQKALSEALGGRWKSGMTLDELKLTENERAQAEEIHARFAEQQKALAEQKAQSMKESGGALNEFRKQYEVTANKFSEVKRRMGGLEAELQETRKRVREEDPGLRAKRDEFSREYWSARSAAEQHPDVVKARTDLSAMEAELVDMQKHLDALKGSGG